MAHIVALPVFKLVAQNRGNNAVKNKLPCYVSRGGKRVITRTKVLTESAEERFEVSPVGYADGRFSSKSGTSKFFVRAVRNTCSEVIKIFALRPVF